MSHGLPPTVDHLRVWGSPCYAYVEKDFRKDEHHNAVSQPCIFIGYDKRNNGYMCYNPSTKHMVTRDAITCNESYVGGIDVLKGAYSKTIDAIQQPNFNDPVYRSVPS